MVKFLRLRGRAHARIGSNHSQRGRGRCSCSAPERYFGADPFRADVSKPFRFNAWSMQALLPGADHGPHGRFRTGMLDKSKYPSLYFVQGDRPRPPWFAFVPSTRLLTRVYICQNYLGINSLEVMGTKIESGYRV